MDATINPFKSDVYTADRDFIKHYHDQMTFYLSKHYKVAEEVMHKWVKHFFQPNKNGFKEVKFKVLQKNKYGDREVKIIGALEFFETVQEKNYHLSPSLVAYTNYNECPSINALGTEKYIGDRKKYKKFKAEAKIAGDDYGERAFDEIQNALKIFNNAQSGAMSSNGTPLRNKSGHTSLTSTCRTVTSTVNLMNERLLNGNRLFINYKKTLQHMIAVLKSTDFIALNNVVERLNLKHATAEQVMIMIRRCAKYYGINKQNDAKIEQFVSMLNPPELTAVLCIGDIHGMFATNPEVIRSYLDDWMLIPEVPADANKEDYANPSNGDYYTLCITKLGQDATPVQINHLNAHHLAVEEKWKDYIQVFFKTKTAVSDVYSVTEMVRESVLTSDTDSSIYSADDVSNLYGGTPEEMIKLNGVLTYFIRLMAIHQHAQLSRNMNVADRNLYNLNMKNEYLFGSYVTTLMSKHYYATQLMQEGVVNKKVKMEIKGVHLRSSKVAIIIKDFAHKLMRDILDVIYYKQKMDPSILLHNVAELERLVVDGVNGGEWSWLSKATIKDEEVYSNPEGSVYQYHELWENVFADKYGAAPPIPYVAVKVNTFTTSKARMEEFYDALGDCEIRTKLQNYMATRGKEDITTFYVPVDNLLSIKNIPIEILKAADTRRIVKQNLKSVYAVLESAGLYMSNKKITRLVSDEH